MIDVTPPKSAHSRWHKIRAWIHTHPQRTYAIVGFCVIVLAFIAAAVVYVFAVPANKPIHISVTKKPVPKTIPPVVYYSPLTGVKVPDEATTKLPVTGIMIENSPDARPQSGLKQAGIVYEAIAEGGITRFLALYQEAKPQLIGPVRSLRMYYLDWAAGYQASITHFGGSAASLTEVGNGSYRNLDLMAAGGQYYWRATDRYAPHNVYTTFAKLDALNTKKGYATSTFTPWPRQDGKPSATPNATSIDIHISGPLYDSHYAYDATTNTYLRNVDGKPSTDREDGQIAPTVVVAMKVDMSTVLQDGYREDIGTTGSGQATIFQDGIATNATWHKNGRMDPLTFTDVAGKEISLDRGQTWVVAVPNSNGSISWQ
jgi:hypothetical protein